MTSIACIPADKDNKLFIKDYRVDGDKEFVKYRSTYNDIPFRETRIWLVDGGQNYVITGEDGTVLYRFAIGWINKII